MIDRTRLLRLCAVAGLPVKTSCVRLLVARGGLGQRTRMATPESGTSRYLVIAAKRNEHTLNRSVDHQTQW